MFDAVGFPLQDPQRVFAGGSLPFRGFRRVLGVRIRVLLGTEHLLQLQSSPTAKSSTWSRVKPCLTTQILWKVLSQWGQSTPVTFLEMVFFHTFHVRLSLGWLSCDWERADTALPAIVLVGEERRRCGWGRSSLLKCSGWGRCRPVSDGCGPCNRLHYRRGCAGDCGSGRCRCGRRPSRWWVLRWRSEDGWSLRASYISMLWSRISTGRCSLVFCGTSLSILPPRRQERVGRFSRSLRRLSTGFFHWWGGFVEIWFAS